MAQIVVLSKLEGLLKFIRPFSGRARALPKEARLSPRGKIATVHQVGARVRVTRAMQGALAAKTGQAPPAVGKPLLIPARPVVASKRMARRVVTGYAKHVVTGKPRRTREVMVQDALQQLDAGGTPRWPKSRSWGRWTAASPTLGGSGGLVGAGWSAALFQEA